MVEAIYQLIKQIWEEGKMPEEWSITVLCPIHKKSNKLNCENYREIALLGVVYKLMSGIVAKKLTDYTRGLKLESYAGQTDNYKIYGGPHVIFSNIMLSILFKIEHNIKTTTHYYYFKDVLHCYLFAHVCCTFSFSSRSLIQYNNPFKLLRKLLDFMLQILLHY
jgi:hypothetical protein